MEIKFIANHLSPGERLGELLFGLIMTLTFTIGAGFLVGTGEGASHELLLATIGCNLAWGVIDAALLILGRIFDRSRLLRLGRAIAANPDDAEARALVAQEFDEMLAPITSPPRLQALYQDIVAQLRNGVKTRSLLRQTDLYAAFAVFCSVMFASLPAVIPYLVIADPWIALRTSNALLIGMMFWAGYRWAGYTSLNRWTAALSLTGFGILMVLVAIALGG